MLLALDMGNTNITIGVFKDEKLILESRISTVRKKMSDEYAIIFNDILRLYKVDTAKFKSSIISSVVPPLDGVIKEAVEQVTGTIPIFVGPGVKTGMDIRIENPAQLGSDFLIGAVAASNNYGAPCVVWDLGTATKFCVVDKNSAIKGCVIMSGLQTSVEGLVANAAMLPLISIEAPEKVIGTNSVKAMQSGLVFGTAAMIDGMTDRIEEELGYPVTVVATGGFAEKIVEHCKRDIIYSRNLLLEGLLHVYNLNFNKD